MEYQQLKIALAQYLSGGDVGGIVGEARTAGAEIVVFLEMYSNGYVAFDPNDPAAKARWCADAESLDGDFVFRFREAARTHQICVVATFPEKAEPQPFNAALLVDAAGRPLLHHRKVHIRPQSGAARSDDLHGPRVPGSRSRAVAAGHRDRVGAELR
jgi:predicted amidohydrolase